jgi:hypothetical protein
MNRDERYKLNDTAFRRLKPAIDKQFPLGHFVALDDGVIIADVANFDELQEKLAAAGRNDPEVFVAQAGVDYPEFAYILIPTTGR